MQVLDFIKLILFGIVESLTEWLPVSSTGHLSVIGHYLGFTDWNSSEVFRGIFFSTLQFGTIVAAMTVFLPMNLPVYRDFDDKLKISKERTRFFLRILPGILPILIIQLLYSDEFLSFTFNHESIRNIRMIIVAMLVGGGLMIVSEISNRNKAELYDTPDSVPFYGILILSGSQFLSFIPGVSRFGLLIMIALLLGCNRRISVMIATYISFPTLLLSFLTTFLLSFRELTGMMYTELLTGFLVSFFVTFVMIRALIQKLSKCSLIPLGEYRIVAAILLFLFTIL